LVYRGITLGPERGPEYSSISSFHVGSIFQQDFGHLNISRDSSELQWSEGIVVMFHESVWIYTRLEKHSNHGRDSVLDRAAEDDLRKRID
jgi:hypothetical protein